MCDSGHRSQAVGSDILLTHIQCSQTSLTNANATTKVSSESTILPRTQNVHS